MSVDRTKMVSKIVIILSLQLLGTVLSKSVSKGNLQVDVTKEVKCKENQKAHEGDKVTVHYGGFLQDGTKFDSSFDRSQPFTFTMGVGQVIPGWDQGLLGVCAGEERHLVVPATLAYGDRGAGDVIPPGAILLFDIVIVNVERADTKQDEELKQKQQEEVQRKKEKEERKRLEEKQRKEEEERLRQEQEAKAHEEEKRRKEEEERKRAEKEENIRKQEQQRKKEQKRQEEQERKRIEEEIKRKEEQVSREEEKLRRQEAQKEQESQRRKEEEEYKNLEEEYYYYEEYASESSCEPGELKLQVTHSPGRCRKIAREGDQLTMHYTGKLSNGRKFDSSVDRNKPFQFTLGVGQVIAGWDEGLSGMCIGEKRTLVIPPDLAYGEQGVGAVIPPCSVLVFDVELLDIAN